MIFIYASSNRAKQFFNFCGHIHPGIKLRNGKTAQKYLLSERKTDDLPAGIYRENII
jgi:hypothetical protein